MVRAGGWAYLRRSDGRLTLDGGRRVVRTEELYDLVHDPAEHADLAARDPAALARMRALFDREAPTPRDAPVAVVHLASRPTTRAHVVDGTLQSRRRNLAARRGRRRGLARRRAHAAPDLARRGAGGPRRSIRRPRASRSRSSATARR